MKWELGGLYEIIPKILRTLYTTGGRLDPFGITGYNLWDGGT